MKNREGFLLRKEITDRQKLIRLVKKIVELSGTNAVFDHLTDKEMTLIEDLDISVFVKDKSKLLWKSKSNFVKFFECQLDKNSKELTIEELGFLTKMSQFIDYEDNTLRNSDHTYITQNDIIHITKWDKNKVRKILNKLINLKYIYKERQIDKRKYKYYLNPNYFYRGRYINKDIYKFYKQ